MPYLSPRIWISMCRGPRQILLDVHVTVSERRQRLVLRERERARELLRLLRHPHSLAAAARRGLDDDRESDRLDELQRLIEVLNRAWSSRNDRHTGFLGQRLAAALSPIWRI